MVESSFTIQVLALLFGKSQKILNIVLTLTSCWPTHLITSLVSSFFIFLILRVLLSLYFFIGEKKDDVKEDTKKKRSDSFVEEPPVKKVKTVEEDKSKYIFIWHVHFQITYSFDGLDDVKPEEPAKDSAMEAEVKAAQQRAVIPLEERVTQFKEMLAEKEV
jgi:hypothetical protein